MCGPVAAKVYSWIRNSSSTIRQEGPRESCSTEYGKQAFHLPTCDKEMSIDTSIFDDSIGNLDRETYLKVSCGDLDVENRVYNTFFPEVISDYLDEEKIKEFLDPMKPVIELLQKELGDTAPPLTDKFFVCMCFGFPFLEEECRVYFKDEAKNALPTPESLEPALQLYCQSKAGQIKKLLEKWLKENEESYTAIIIANNVEILTQKSQTVILRQLHEDVTRFTDVVFDYYHLCNAPQKLMFDLVSRTTLFLGNYSAATVADKYVKNNAHFRMKGGSVIKIDGEMHGDGESYPTWFKVSMNFCLSNGNKVEIPSPDLRQISQDLKELEVLINKLSPVTELLQECIDKAMKDEESIPKIDNIFTVYYFLSVMQFNL